MPLEIASLSSSDTTLKVLRGKPFNIALSSFLSVSTDEPMGNIGFSSDLSGVIMDNGEPSLLQEDKIVTTNLELTTNFIDYYLYSKTFASVTCDSLPSGVNLLKEWVTPVSARAIYYYCNPIDLLTNTYPSNTRLYGMIDSAGTYEFYLKADILSIPFQFYSIARNSLYNLFQNPPHSLSSQFLSAVYTDSGGVVAPLQIGESRTRHIVRISSDTIKVTLIVEEPPTLTGSGSSNPNPNPTQATTGSVTSEVELHVIPITTSILTSSSKSITVPFTATRIATTSAPTQSFMVKFGGVNVMDVAFVTTSNTATSCVISAKISKTSSSIFKFDILINSSIGGVQQQSITRTKSVSIASFSNSNLSFYATNAAGSNAPIISNVGNIDIV